MYMALVHDAMARLVWHSGGGNPATVVTILEQGITEGGRFEPKPGNVDRRILHQASLMLLRKQIAGAHTEKDRLLAQEVRGVDDLIRTANLLLERLREWYSLHAPEAVRSITEGADLARLISEHGDREQFAAAVGKIELATESVGSELGEADLATVRSFATALDSIYNTWKTLQDRIAATMDEIAPNLTALLGAQVGARLISQAGSLSRLASFPSSTFQTLGAETALFRHIKEGTKPPKHGLIFQHPLIHASPPAERGRIAKAISNTGVLAARMDLAGSHFEKELVAKLEANIERIRANKKDPMRHRAAPGQYGGKDFQRRGGYSSGPPRDSRGPPRDSRGPPSRGPPRDDRSRGPSRGPPQGGFERGPPRDSRGPPSRGPPQGGFERGPTQGGWERRADAPRGPPQSGFSRGDGARGPPRDARGPPRDNRGPPRDSRGPPRDNRSFDGAAKRYPNRGPRGDSAPARPPGRG